MRISRWVLLILITAVLALPLHAQETATTQNAVTHVVQAGETLYRIALRYGVPMDAIAAANSIANYNAIFAGQSLVIPGLSVPGTSVEATNPLVAAPPIVHTVTYGDTLESIAIKYGTTSENIMKANSLANANTLALGQQLNIWSQVSAQTQEAIVESVESAPAQPESAPQPQVIHTVQRGEFIAQIARRYNVSAADIISANNIGNPDRIYAGQQLVIPGASASANVTPPTTDWASTQGNYGERPLVTPPQPSVTSGKLIMVDLSDSMTYAFQDGVLVYSALSSMGLPATPTVKGQFKIYNRLPSQTMSGPGYYLPGVQYVQYFYQGYALHGAYWHDNFGQPMSHGCVNLRNDDAAWFYAFGEIGTPVHVID